jgi:hypothetical protein
MGTRGPSKLALFTSIKFTKLFQRLLHDRFCMRRVAFIANATMRLPTGGANISDRLMEIGSASGANKYAGSLARIGSGDRPADAAAAPVISATLPLNFCSPLLAIVPTLSHSNEIGETREKLSTTVDLRASRARAHRPGQSLGSSLVGFDLRRPKRSTRGPHPLFAFLRPIFMISGILLFFLPLAAEDRSAVSIGPRAAARGRKDVAIGQGLSLGSMVLLGSAMSLAQVYEPFFASLQRIPGAMRQSHPHRLHCRLLGRDFSWHYFSRPARDWKPVPAFVVANLFYSALHFVEPPEKYFLSGIDPWAGFRHLFSTLRRFSRPLRSLQGDGSPLIGIVLSYAFARTGALYMSIGLHAGWVISIKTVRVFGNYQTENLGWLFGATDPKIVSGVVTWAGILLVGIVIHVLTRERARAIADPLLPKGFTSERYRGDETDRR